MNIKLSKKHYDLITAFAGGVTFGSVIAKLVLGKKFKDAMEFQIESLQNTYEATIALRDASDRVREELLDVFDTEHNAHAVDIETPITDVDAPDFIGSINNEKSVNPYHQAVISTPEAEPVVVNPDADYGVAYIDEEDYHDEDGRDKKQIDIILDDEQPVFIMDNEQIDDWDRRIGDSILVDFFKLCPPGTPAILYVRNHRTEVDYEVVRVEP